MKSLLLIRQQLLSNKTWIRINGVVLQIKTMLLVAMERSNNSNSQHRCQRLISKLQIFLGLKATTSDMTTNLHGVASLTMNNNSKRGTGVTKHMENKITDSISNMTIQSSVVDTKKDLHPEEYSKIICHHTNKMSQYLARE